MKTTRHTISGSLPARELAAYLVDYSVWFEVTPLCDDEWEFRVKAEETRALHKAIGLVGAA